MQCERKERNGVNEMVKHGLVPNIDKAVAFDCRFEPVCAKGSQRDCEKTKRCCNSEKQDRHECLCHSERTEESPIIFASIGMQQRNSLRCFTAFNMTRLYFGGDFLP